MTDQGPGYYPNPTHYQPYPQQPAYPQDQGYPQPQGYQQVPSYPKGPGEAPPSYYGANAPPPPQATNQSNTNVVVVNSQPQPVVTTVHRTSGDYASGALIFAIFATFCIFFFGCWWSLICSIIAIVFAINASAAAAQGDLALARSQQNISMVCSVISVVSTLLGFIILIIVIAVEVSASAAAEDT